MSYFTVAFVYFRLGWANVNDWPAELGNEARRVRAPRGARNRIKATVKIRRNPLFSFHDPFFSIEI